MQKIKNEIVIISGKYKNKRFKLQNQLTIGRSPENTVQIDSPHVSRFQAVIENTSSGYYIRDLDSRNGTFVEGKKIKRKRLKQGDSILIGKTRMRFETVKLISRKSIKNKQVKFKDTGNTSDTMMFYTAPTKKLQKSFLAAPGKTANIAHLRRTQARLSAITESIQHISGERNLKKLFTIILNQIFKLTKAHNGVILTKHDTSDDLQVELTKRGNKSDEIIISSTIVKHAFEKNEAILSVDAAGDSRFKDGASIITQNISSVMCVPLKYQKETLGVIYVDTHGTKNAFEQEDLELLVTLSASASIAIKNAQYVNELEQAYHDTLVVTANAIEMRDHYTVGHTWRVTNLALEIAKELGWDKEQLELCEKGSVLHDVGKIAVSDDILNKPSPLTEKEYAVMKIHPERGARMMKDVKYLKNFIPYCLYHHERWDGKGYPNGLKGKEIPIEGRVIAVADSFDAMTSGRPYRPAMNLKDAVAEIKKSRNSQFDPICVDAFIKCYKKGKIKQLLQDFQANDAKAIVCPFCSSFVKLTKSAKSGSKIVCEVCRCQIKLEGKNKRWYGRLVSESTTKLFSILSDEIL